MMKFKLILAYIFYVAMGSYLFAQTKPVDSLLTDFRNWAQKEGLNQTDLKDLRITDDYLSKHNKVRHIYVQQVFREIAVVNSNASFHVWNGKIISTHQKFFAGNANKAANNQPSLDASQALKHLAIQHNWQLPVQIRELSPAKGLEQRGELGRIEVSQHPIPYRLVYFGDEKGKLKLGCDLVGR